MTEQEIKDLIRSVIKEELRIEIETKTSYTGGDPLYEKYHQIGLALDDGTFSYGSID